MPYISLHVIPGASKNEITGWVAGADGQRVLKVKLTAPAQDGKANAALLKFLAKAWGVKPHDLELAAGETLRHKRLKINDETLAVRLVVQLS